MNRNGGSALRLLGAGLLLATAACSSSRPDRAEYWLCAKPGGVTMPDGVSVAIWGYVLDAPGFAGGCAGEPSLPGPALRVGAGDASLTLHLRNLLPEPTSIVIPGQTATMTPVFWDADGVTTAGARTSPTQRVRSFTHEAAAGGGEATYAWGGVRPGTYLYHSGTHPQVQVQMGLYGALGRDAVDGGRGLRGERAPAAYAGVRYDAEVLLVFSELDPAQHLAIADGTYGTDQGPTSTLRYAPQYYLLNGKPFTAGSAPLASVAAGSRTLLRLVNAGLQSYAPTIQGVHMRMIAEGGHPYPWGANPREQYSTLLPSLGTVDALVVPPPAGAAARYPIYDRRLNLTTGAAPDGGMLGYLAVRAP
jgi:FtsP/CotA-like multicopper oxidase with cupredoxin domain